MKYFKIIAIILTLNFTFACGEKAGPKVLFDLAGADPYLDPLVDIVRFKVVSQDGLDIDNNGIADVFGFPENCTADTATGFEVGCGYPITTETFSLKNIPLNSSQGPLSYIVRVFFINSNASDQILYWGESASFLNSTSTSVVTIVVQAGSPS